MKTDTETAAATETKFTSIRRIGVVVGLITSLALVGYFLLMKVLGLSHVLELRYFNVVILAIGICYGIRKLRNELKGEDFYLKGWLEGFYIAAFAIVPFAVFMSFYLIYLDPALLEYIRQNTNENMPMNGLSIFITLILEGGASTVIIILAAMQYFKRNGGRKNEITE